MKIWTHWGLNPGPSACEADVIPLHHVPDEYDVAVNAWLAWGGHEKLTLILKGLVFDE